MKVNGEEKSIEKNQSLLQFLTTSGLDTASLAVALNGEIIPKSTYAEVILKEEDHLEIVRFVGGGAV